MFNSWQIHGTTKTKQLRSAAYRTETGSGCRRLRLETLETRWVLAAPTALPDAISVLEGGTSNTLLTSEMSLLANDTDPDAGDTLQVNAAPVVAPLHGTLVLNADGTFEYTHNGTEEFTDSFIYEVFDTGGDTSQGLVTITIAPVNDNVPVAEAGGPYTLVSGDDLNLDASGSIDADLDAMLVYRWDFNLDGVPDFETTDPIASAPAATVISSGLSGGVHTISLMVDDGIFTATDTAELRIFEELSLTLPTDGIDNSIILRRNGPLLEILDASSNTVLADTLFDFTTRVNIVGGNDNTTLVMDFAAGPVFPSGGIDFAGGTGTDSLELESYIATSVTHTLETITTGRINIDGALVRYLDLELVSDHGAAIDRLFDYLSLTPQQLAIDSPAPNTVTATSNVGVQTEFTSPSGTLVFRSGPSEDTITSTVDGLTAGVVMSVIAGEGADRIEVRATSADTETIIEGNDGNDLIILGSVANAIDELVGAVTVRGGTHDPAPLISDPITAKGRTLGQALVEGDTLQLNDAGAAGPHTYTVSDTMLVRTGMATVNYETIESLEFLSGGGGSTLTVTTTTPQTRTHITTQDADDVITVQNTGAASITHITTAGGMDTVTVQSTGAASGLSLDTGNENDTIRFDGNGTDSNVVLQASAGADTILVRATSAGSFSDLQGGSGNDLFVLGSATGSLDNLFGEICIFGEGEDNAPLIPDPITAKGRTLGQALVVGDTLQLNDAGDAGPHTYTVSDTMLTRTGVAPITFDNIESLELLAGIGASAITVTTTAPQTRTHVTTQDADDVITVQNTGAASITHINTAGRDDTVTVETTGEASGLSIDAGNENDAILLNGNGIDSNVVLQASAGADIVRVGATATGSFSDLRGGSGNDVFVLGSAMFSLDNLLGEVCVFGEEHEGTPPILDPIIAKGRTLGQALVVGDTLRFSDAGDVGAHTYALTDTTFDRSGMATVTYEAIESLELVAGVGVSTITVHNTAPQTHTRINTQDAADTITLQNTGAGSITHITTAGGMDTVTVQSTGAASGLSLDTGNDNDTIRLDGNGTDSNVVLQAGAGADTILVRTTSSGSFSDLRGSSGNDLFVLGSASGSLDNLLGAICIFGEQHEGAPTISDPITAKGRTLGQALVVGDTLQVNDAGAAGPHAYTVSDTMLTRTGMATITFETVESLELLAGIGASTISVITTTAQTSAHITTQNADDVFTVQTTGANSITHITTAGGMDTVTVQSTGAASGLSLDTGTENDTIRLDGNGTDSNVVLQAGAGADTILVRVTSAGSFSDLQGGSGNDRFVLGSATGSLDDLLGEISVFGEQHEGAPTIPDPITANGRTLGQALVVGDTLQLNDAGAAGPHTYTVSDTMLIRTGMATVTYNTIESMELLAGIGASAITITTTVPQTRVRITTQDANDTLTLQNTGEGSITHISTAAGSDIVTVQNTGLASGLSLHTGDDSDSITLDGNGVDSNVVLRAGGGNDTIDFESSSIGSVSVLDGGDVELIDGDDTIQIAPTAMRLDQIRGSVFVDGNTHDAANTHLVRQDRFTIPGSRYTTSSMLVEAPPAMEARGDILKIFDRANTSDGTFHIGSTVVRRNTTRIDYENIEQLEIRGGSGNDVFDVLLPTGPSLSMPTVTVMDGAVGHSEVIIDGSSQDDTILVGPDASPAGMQRTMFEVAGGDVCLHLIGRSGNDHISNATNLPALIEGGDGDDILVGGSTTDVLFGGPDVDALFGMAGDDFLFSDLDVQGNSNPAADELLDGGSQVTRPPGDTAAQTGRDAVRNIETLSDGGAEKDVITWLSAQLAGNDAAAIAQLVDQAMMQLSALGCQADTARSTQVRMVDVVAPLSATTTHSTSLGGIDVNQDGAVTPLDALLVINALSNSAEETDRRTDVNGDGLISPLDAVLVINQLGSIAAAAAQGSPAAPLSATASRPTSTPRASDTRGLRAAQVSVSFDIIENLGMTTRTRAAKLGAIARRQVDGG